MKKTVSLLLALVMLVGMMSFAAAEAKEEMTLNVMLPDFYADSEWKTLEDGNPVLQAIYDATGVKLNITWVANSAYTEMTSLTLADSKNMPEVMVIQGPRDAITINSARAGAFWDLTDYIPQPAARPSMTTPPSTAASTASTAPAPMPAPASTTAPTSRRKSESTPSPRTSRNSRICALPWPERATAPTRSTCASTSPAPSASRPSCSARRISTV